MWTKKGLWIKNENQSNIQYYQDNRMFRTEKVNVNKIECGEFEWLALSC